MSASMKFLTTVLADTGLYCTATVAGNGFTHAVYSSIDDMVAGAEALDKAGTSYTITVTNPLATAAMSTATTAIA